MSGPYDLNSVHRHMRTVSRDRRNFGEHRSPYDASQGGFSAAARYEKARLDRASARHLRGEASKYAADNTDAQKALRLASRLEKQADELSRNRE